MTQRQTARALLKAVNQAILEIVSGAVSATISTGGGAQSYTRADLSTLRQMRKELQIEAAAYAGRRRITMTGARYA